MQKIISESKLSFYLVSSALILFYISDGGNKYFQLGQYANDDAIEDSFSISIYFRLLYEIFFASKVWEAAWRVRPVMAPWGSLWKVKVMSPERTKNWVGDSGRSS